MRKNKSPRRGAYIELISLNPGEQEVLFPLGVRYLLVEKREEEVADQLLRVIVLEVVD